MKKEIILGDTASLKDEISVSNIKLNEGEILDKRNLFRIFKNGDMNNEVARGFNIITVNGRKFNAAKLFGVESIIPGASIFNSGVPTNSDLTIKAAGEDTYEIIAWGGGSGAAPANDLFNPSAPTVNDILLDSATKFYAEEDTRANPDEDVLKGQYFDNTYKKTTTDRVLKQDANSDYYLELTLTVEYSELKGTALNELGTYCGDTTRDGNGDVTGANNFFLYSRLTFSSLPNSQDSRDNYTIKYNVYL